MVKSDEVISLSADIPPWKATELLWIDPRNAETQKSYFGMSKVFQKAAESVDLIVCNSSLEFEPAACNLIPGCLTVGPLIERDDVLRASGAAGSFWLEDTSCLDWLDTKPPGSVIYVAFGSAANLYQHEFDELKINAANLKKKAQESVLPGGSSFKNFEKFINFLRF